MNSEENTSNYHQLILNDEQPNAPQNKIYTIKFITLILTMVIVFCTTAIEQQKLVKNTELLYIAYIAIVAAFGISCFSSFIGHRKLFLISYGSLLLFFVLVNTDFFKRNLLVWFLLTTAKRVLLIQVMIQICGTWPSQFARILTELVIFSMLVFIVMVSFNNPEIFVFSLFAVILINYVLIAKSINNFKQPETDSVPKDIARTLFNIKPLIFTLLIGFSASLIVLLQIDITEYAEKAVNESIASLTILFLFITFIVFVVKLRNVHYQSTLIIAASLVLLLAVGTLVIAQLINYEYVQFYMHFFLILVLILQNLHMIPQYQRILLNIGIRNLDFASSYQSLAVGIIETSNILFLVEENEFIENNLQIIILAFMGVIVILSFTFYQLLGFKQYFIKSNRAQVEENELQIQVV
ncbi:hypothetical protein pb186bvf_009186 [Paramecium bursaria]